MAAAVSAWLFAALLVFGSPFAGQIRTALAAAFPADFVRIVGSLIAVAIGGAFFMALVRVREQRVLRLAILSAALALGAAVAVQIRTGLAQVDIVERFHFVEYGLLTVVCYRVWRPREDASTWLLPLLAGVLVGTIDEWVQWVLPSRVGELRDVALDAASCLCGLLFSVGFDPPPGWSRFLTFGPGSRALVARFGILTTAALAVFFQSVHLGYVIVEPEGQTFRSTYSRAQLAAAAADRSRRWRVSPPTVPRLIAVEDHYLSEALWHVQRRNRAWSAGDIVTAWQENRILELAFEPALSTPSFYARGGFRWPDAQRIDADQRSRSGRGPYVSDAEPYTVRAWPQWIFWLAAAAVVAVLAWWPSASRHRRPS